MRKKQVVCKYGHDKSVTGEYSGGRCRECCKAKQRIYYQAHPQQREKMLEKYYNSKVAIQRFRKRAERFGFVLVEKGGS